jgi:hypothetical protein
MSRTMPAALSSGQDKSRDAFLTTSARRSGPACRKKEVIGSSILFYSASMMRKRENCRDAIETVACVCCDSTRFLEQRLARLGEPFPTKLKGAADSAGGVNS